MRRLRWLASITGFGALVVLWEVVTLRFFPRYVWSELFARRSALALPIVVLCFWLPIHLLRYRPAARIPPRR